MKAVRVLGSALILFSCVSFTAGAEVLAGAAACDITPDVEEYTVPMAGYGARDGKPSTGIADPLQAKVLYFKDDDSVAALVTADLRSITPELKRQIIAKAGNLGLNASNLMVAASHNHSGPSLYPETFWQLQFGEYDPAIVEHMTDRIAQALERAAQTAQPVSAGAASTMLPDFTRNRRWDYAKDLRDASIEHPAEHPRLWVMRLDTAEGAPLALLTNFATHPTILGADNFALTAEWPGQMQRALEESFPGAVALYTNGAEGDQAPDGAKGDDAFARARDFGTRLAQHAAKLAKGVETSPIERIDTVLVETPLGEPIFSEASKSGPYAFMRPHAMKALPRFATLQQLALDDIVLAGLPGEPVCEVGLATEAFIRKAGAREAIVIGLANDYIGYILNAKEYARGGYEVDSRSYYGPGLGDLIARESGVAATHLFGTDLRERETIELFNGETLDGWLPFAPGATEPVWTVEDGILKCSGNPRGYIRTTEYYWDYRLKFEWRWPEKGGNNGVLAFLQEPDAVWPKSLEVQLQHGSMGDYWVIGGLEIDEHVDTSTRRVVKPAPDSEKPLGEWNSGEVICDGSAVVVYMNGELQSAATNATSTFGYIALQSEGTPIEFRNIVLEPLE